MIGFGVCHRMGAAPVRLTLPPPAILSRDDRMSTQNRATDVPDRVESINHAAWDRAFRAWERRRALPNELIELDRRDAAAELRRNKRPGAKAKKPGTTT